MHGIWCIQTLPLLLFFSFKILLQNFKLYLFFPSGGGGGDLYKGECLSELDLARFTLNLDAKWKDLA